MPVFVSLPLADDRAKAEDKVVWGTFNVDHIAAIVPDAYCQQSYIMLKPKDSSRKKYDEYILSCTYEEAIRYLNEALISDSIHSILKEPTE